MQGVLFLSALIPLISAHTRFTTLFVNSQSQGDGTCIRMDMDPSTTTDFISSITSTDMACGVEGEVAVNRTCPLNPGDSISLLHRLYTDGSQPGSIDPSHKGSTAVYMKRLASVDSSDPYSTSASGNGWFKLAWNGYDTTSGQWGTEKMIANDGKVDAMVPNDLPGGYYLVRSEVLALQNIIDDKVSPQFYAGCAQVYVNGASSGDVNAPTMSIPGYIDNSASALSYDIYSNTPPAVPYVEFGPKVYEVGSSSSISVRAMEGAFARSPRSRHYGSKRPTYNNVADTWEGGSNQDSEESNDVQDTDPNTTVVATGITATEILPSNSGATTTSSSPNSNIVATSAGLPSTSQASTTASPSGFASSPSMIGTCPSNTILTVANQCLIEISSWSSDTPGSIPKCWAASQQCWDTLDKCWDNLSPAINADDMTIGCHAWESKCNALVDWCNEGNLEGPPVWSGGNVNGSERRLRRNMKHAIRHIASAKRRDSRW